MNRYELVPELRTWDEHNGGEESPEGWASCMGSYSLASAYACLVWPQLVEVSGMIFREGVTEQDVEGWLAHTQGNKQSVEATLNHLHILESGQRLPNLSCSSSARLCEHPGRLS